MNKKSTGFLFEVLVNALFAILFYLAAKMFSLQSALLLVPGLFAIMYILYVLKNDKKINVFNRLASGHEYAVTDVQGFSLAAAAIMSFSILPFVVVALQPYVHKNAAYWLVLFLFPMVIYVLFLALNPFLQKINAVKR